MNPSSGEAPKFELPATPAIPETEGHSKSPETVPSQETSPGKRAPVAVPTTPLAISPSISVPSGYQSSKVTDNDSTNKLTAAEVDRIEKEWIDKAKAIVTKTQDDPHEQNSEMGKVKADYIKKRFNKTIPTDDTVTV